jgi:hypothetical protein
MTCDGEGLNFLKIGITIQNSKRSRFGFSEIFPPAFVRSRPASSDLVIELPVLFGISEDPNHVHRFTISGFENGQW